MFVGWVCWSASQDGKWEDKKSGVTKSWVEQVTLGMLKTTFSLFYPFAAQALYISSIWSTQWKYVTGVLVGVNAYNRV